MNALTPRYGKVGRKLYVGPGYEILATLIAHEEAGLLASENVLRRIEEAAAIRWPDLRSSAGTPEGRIDPAILLGAIERLAHELGRSDARLCTRAAVGYDGKIEKIHYPVLIRAADIPDSPFGYDVLVRREHGHSGEPTTYISVPSPFVSAVAAYRRGLAYQISAEYVRENLAWDWSRLSAETRIVRHGGNAEAAASYLAKARKQDRDPDVRRTSRVSVKGPVLPEAYAVMKVERGLAESTLLELGEEMLLDEVARAAVERTDATHAVVLRSAREALKARAKAEPAAQAVYMRGATLALSMKRVAETADRARIAAERALARGAPDRTAALVQ